MAYCVHCGVELAPTQSRCPLCGIQSIDPLAESSVQPPCYPQKGFGHELKRSARKAAGLVAALILLIPFLTVLACDLTLNGALTWSRFVLVVFPLIYALVIPGLMLRRNKAMAMVLITWPAATLTLYLLCLVTKGSWFVSFALPVSAALFLILAGLPLLARRLPGKPLTIAGSAFVCTGLLVVLLEARLNHSFFPANTLSWSFYSLIPCLLIGLVLFVIDASPALKQALHRRLFL